MVILGKRYGQLGNRLVVFAHLIANAIENNYLLLNPSFDEYAHLFESTSVDMLCRFPPRSSLVRGGPWTRKLLYRLFYEPAKFCHRASINNSIVQVVNITKTHDQPNEIFNLAGPQFAEIRARSRVVVLQGWKFRDNAGVLKYADVIRGHFVPRACYRDNVDRLIDAARRDCDLLVGVHIRQGDYQHWLGGEHYHPTSFYIDWMQHIQRELPDRRVGFLICSNVPQDKAQFAGLHTTIARGNLIEDMYSLAECDLIIGPPSTFTAWAAFYRGTPLCHIFNDRHDIRLDRYKSVRSIRRAG